MSKRKEIEERFARASEDEKKLMLALTGAILAELLQNLAQPAQETDDEPVIDAGPVLDREVWAEIEDLL